MAAVVEHASPSSPADEEPDLQHYTQKRVSFGEQQHVTTFVYEKELTPTTSSQRNLQQHHKQPFTGQDSPPSKVTVKAERSEVPNPIGPPGPVDPAVSTHYQQEHGVIFSPPLPSFVSRMESEHENPFRPEDVLYHQVDPIVEAYKYKPYPHGDPRNGTENSPAKTQNGDTKDKKKDSKKAKQKKHSKEEQHLNMSVNPEQVQLQYSDNIDSRAPPPNKGHQHQDITRGTLNSPQANKAEVVHLGNEQAKTKRKCGCCVVQ